jgi:hypothetical protein
VLTRIHTWLHRHAVARTINGTANNWNRNAESVIETRGPRWLGHRLWRFTLRHSPTMRPDWYTVRVSQVQRVGRWTYRWTYRWTVTFKRVK